LALLASHGVLTLHTLIFRPVERVASLPLLPWWLGTLCTIAGTSVWLSLTVKSRHTARPNSVEEELRSPLPAIVDFSASTSRDYGASSVRQTVVSALAKWSERRRTHYPSRDAYLAALVRHLRRCAPGLGIRREVWLGRSRELGVADLMLGGELLVELQKGLGRRTADWSLSQLRSYQLARPSLPKLFVVFDAPREPLDDSLRVTLEQLHQQANTVTVRV
jgi:hypothetical protein